MPDKERGDTLSVSPLVGSIGDKMVNPFEEYINKLEGAGDLDPQKIVSDLHTIHNQEIGTREAKISTLNESISDKDRVNTDLAKELTAQKARNFDLVDVIPNSNKPQSGNQSTDEKPDGASIKITDLFKPEVRNRHNGI